MANSVDLIIGSEAIKQIEKAINLLSIADQKIIDISQSSLEASKGYSKIFTPSGLDKAVSNTAALNAQLEKQNAIITKLHADIAKKAEQSRLAEIKLQQQREKAFDSFEKNAQKEAAANDKTANAYNKTQTQINRLTSAYNDLAVRKERYNNLNANEEMRLQTLSRVNEKYNGILKTTDATIGKNQRNVGNYASGYNALGNSINQLSREAPAFANSINTGFMALSNNFPALFDAINGIRERNKLLVAEGQKPVSIFKELGASIFSFQTLLSVGVTLLTIYGADIIKWAGSLITGAKGIDTIGESIKQLNEARISGTKSAQQELTQLTINLAVAKDINLSYKERMIAVDELQKQYPAYLGNLSKEQILAGDTAKAELSLRDAILSRAKASAATQKITENQALIIDLEEKRVDVLKRVDTAQRNYNNRLKIYNETKDPAVNTALAQSEAELARSKSSLLSIDEEIASITTINNRLTSYAIENSSKSIALDTEKEKKAKKKKELKKEEVEGLQSELKVQGSVIEQIDKYIDYLRTEIILNSGNTEATSKLTKALGEAQQARKDLFGTPTADIKIINDIEEVKDAVKTLSEESKQYLESFINEFASNSGFSETFKILTKEIDGFGENFAVTFNAIAESAQEAYNFISNLSQDNFENEYDRLESQKEVSLKFAGDSASAKTKIEEEYEKKHKEIASRENKAKKQQAIFNIAIDTAQAVVAALPNLVLAGIIAAFGITQAVIVANKEIPQYFDGTDNHAGGLMLVNDGSGSNYQEKVILPSGKEIIPEGRNVLMNAPKGTKVLTHEQQIMQMLNERGISMHANYNKNNGVTAQEIDSVMSKHFAKIQTNTTTIDKRGFRQWNEKNGNKTIQNNNRVSRTGFKI